MVQLSQYLPAALTECKCINFDSETFQFALVCVIAAPLVWNIVARTIRNILPASTSMTVRYIICYILAIWIFGFSSFRDILSVQTINTA